MRIIWDFIQNQILGMKWLNELIGNLIYLTGLDLNSKIGSGHLNEEGHRVIAERLFSEIYR